jgi:competence protein ComFC
MFNFIKDIIAPKKCYSCNIEWHFLCNKCFNKIEKHYFFDEICYVCKKYSKNFEVHKNCKDKVFYDKTIIMSHYKIKVIKKLIKDFKFYGKKDIIDDIWELLIEKMIKYMFSELKEFKREDFIVISPPMSFFRKLKRWYNHSELIAKKVWKELFFKYEKNVILKNKQTRQQSKLNRQDRLQNLKKAFKINKKKLDIIDNKIIILIDDVISTWTTANEISKILKQNKAQKTIITVFASD